MILTEKERQLLDKLAAEGRATTVSHLIEKQKSRN